MHNKKSFEPEQSLFLRERVNGYDGGQSRAKTMMTKCTKNMNLQPATREGAGVTNFGQTKFGQAFLPSLAERNWASTNFGQTKFGQHQLWPNQVWPVLTLAKPSLANCRQIHLTRHCFSCTARVFHDVCHTTLAQVSARARHVIYMVIHVVHPSVCFLNLCSTPCSFPCVSPILASLLHPGP